MSLSHLWANSEGGVRIERHFNSPFISVTLRGRLPAKAGDVVYDAVCALLEPAPAVMFWDMWELVGYDSRVRTRSTDALLAQKQHVRELHAVTRSKLVAMGVSVASMATNIPVVSYVDKEAFERARKSRE